MARKAYRAHRHCGARLPNRDTVAFCPACRKWLVGDSVVLVRVRDGKVLAPTA